MKKIVLTSILVTAIIVTLVVTGIFIVDNYLHRRYDLEFLSVDEEACIIFEDVSDEKHENHYEYNHYNHIVFYPVENEIFYKKYIELNPNYLYDIEENVNYLSREYNEKLYVLLINKHYFFVQHGDNGVDIYEGMRSFYTNYYTFYAHVPCLQNFYGDKESFVPWEESVGLSSFEDLLLYYSRLPDTVYKVDAETQTIHLSVYNKSLGWMESGVKLEVSDTGFKITLMPEFYNMEVDWDLL